MANTHIPKARWARIIPLTLIMYTIASIDRNNISFAFAGMEKDLAIGAGIVGLAGGIFFIGYLFLQVPGGIWATKWGAKYVVAAAIVLWGVLAFANGLVQNTTELLIVRFLLGLVEGLVWPSMIVMISRWFPLGERGRANSYFVICVPLASIIMSPLSGFLVQALDWRWMFFVEGALPFVFLPFWLLLVSDSPQNAKWLQPAERAYLLSQQAEDRTRMPQERRSIRTILTNRSVLALVGAGFFIQLGFYGFGLWLPTIVKQLSGGDFLTTGLISALPWVAAIVGLIVAGRHSDKTRERRWHVAVVLAVGAVLLLASTIVGASSPVIALGLLTLSMGFVYAYDGVYWALVADVLPERELGGTSGLINGIGNLGGFVGPSIFGFLLASTGVFLSGIVVLVVALFLAATLILVVRPHVQARGNRTALTESTTAI